MLERPVRVEKKGERRGPRKFPSTGKAAEKMIYYLVDEEGTDQ